VAKPTRHGADGTTIDERHLRSPSDYRARATLRDGTSIVVRAIRPDDRDEEAAFVVGLSNESRYLRFFAPKRALTEAEIRYFTDPDVPSHVALVAKRTDAPGEPILAVGRYAALPGSSTRAEVAFAVADALHGRGIATVLLDHLAAIARANGFSELRASVLSHNRAMLDVLAHSGFEPGATHETDVVEMALRLDRDRGARIGRLPMPALGTQEET
jgi:GNAT superfamily N-acetyltransferase